MKLNCNFTMGKNIPKNNKLKEKIPFLNVSAANNKINKYVFANSNIFIGDVTLSLDANTGLVNNHLEGFNGYLYKVRSDKYKNYEIYYSLKNKINQKIIKINETGTTIKHSPNSKKELLIFNIPKEYEQFYKLTIKLKTLIKRIENTKKSMIKLLIK